MFCAKGKNTTQATNKMCVICDEVVIAERTMRKCFSSFKVDDLNLEDQENSIYIFNMIVLNISKSTIHKHFVKFSISLYKRNE